MRKGALESIADRWRAGHVLKRDVFSTVERGRFATPAGEAEAVLRHLDDVPWWSRPLARFLLRRERRALERVDRLGIAPPLLFADKSLLIRGWIDGFPLHIAPPHGDVAYFRHAKAVLRTLHRHGICHNDLAKSQNWVRSHDGRAFLIDFQLAKFFSRRGLLFRVAAYEDLRHLLKHKRRYAGHALTASERRVLARKSLPTRIWMATGKKVYLWITRSALRYADREGGGVRLMHDSASVASRLKSFPGVREAAVVAYPDRRTGTGLYAFVEAAPAVSERELSSFVAAGLGAEVVPDKLQVVHELPRRPTGEVHTEILQLVALNQVDRLDRLIASETERAKVARIVDDRRNLRDRTAG